MKNWLTAAMFVFLGSVALSAAEGKSIDVVSKNVVVVNFEDIQSKKALIRLIDEAGYELWSTTIRNAGSFKKKINLRNLPSGTYSIILNDGDVIFMQQIEKKSQFLNVIEESAVIAFAPESKYEDGHLTIKYASEDVKLNAITILDERGNEIFRDQPKNSNNFQMAYDLTRLEDGEYTIVMSTSFSTYYNSIVK